MLTTKNVAPKYFIILYYIIWYYIILYYIILYYIVLYYSLLYHIILYYIILHFIILYCIILYYVILYCIILYNIMLYGCKRKDNEHPLIHPWQFRDLNLWSQFRCIFVHHSVLIWTKHCKALGPSKIIAYVLYIFVPGVGSWFWPQVTWLYDIICA